MPTKNNIELRFPIGGVSRIAGYQTVPPFTTPDAMNVLPFDSAEGRARGGSRDGTRKAYFNDLGGAVRMLASVDYIQNTVVKVFTDSFDSNGLGGAWVAVGSLTMMSLADDYAEVSALQTAAAATVPGILAGSDYTVAAYIAPYDHAFHGVYRIYLRMDSGSPAPTVRGVIVEVSMVGDAISATLLSYTGSVETVVDTYFGVPQSYADGSWLRAVVVGSGPTVTVYWGETELLSGTVDAHTGLAVGFGATCLSATGRCLFEQFRVYYSYNSTEYNRQQRKLFAASSGIVCLENITPVSAMRMEQDTENLTLASDRDLCAAQYGQKLYIADWGEEIATGTGTVNGMTFDSASYADWTAAAGAGGTKLGVAFTTAAADDYVVEILTVAASTATVGSYTIATVAAGALTLDTSGSTASTSCTFRIVRMPKIYSPLTLGLSRWTATTGKGNVPNQSRVLARYRERMVLCESNQWYMSRQGDPLDWFYGKSNQDAKRAMTGSLADSGVPGDTITALANSNDDYLLMFCPTSTWLLVGDPAYTGQLKNISETIGCVGSKAWCYGVAGEVYFLSRGGLAIMRGATATPELLGLGKIPRELTNVNAELYTVSLVYDLQEHRVYIFITDPNSNRAGTHWCFDVRTESFWPLQFPSSIQPTAAYYYTSQLPEDSCVILGCRDGYLRRFDRYCDTDDGNSFNSYVVYGPIELGSGYRQGRIDELIADVARLSRNVTWQLRVGNNAEAAFRATAATSGTWVDGKNKKNRPRLRGSAFCLKVGRFASNVAGWGMERITVVRAILGQRRDS